MGVYVRWYRSHGRLLVPPFAPIDERSLVYFADNPTHLLKAYADCGEGVDRAGGFAIQESIPVAQT
ncbi:hypothetical protein MPER_02233 [Moniliophthora perniciosa FA553]|nr:hypothetical protein MPER_02233 [Moniliophthora perniciosa FA553]